MRYLNNWINSYLDYTDNTEPPTLYRKWAAVATIAAVLQRKCFVHWVREAFYPNLYIVLVGPSGAARKGVAMGSALEFLLEPGLNVKLSVDSTSRASLIRDIKGAQDTYMDEEGKLHTHSSLTVFTEEATVFLGYKDLQLLTDLTDWYNSKKNPWVHKTISGSAQEIFGICLNLFAASTPNLIQSSLPVEAIGGGLVGRIIFVYAAKKERKVPIDFESEEQLVIKKHLMEDLNQIALISGPFNVSQECLDYYIEWYYNYDEEKECKDEKFSGFFERKPTTLRKLCLILSAARSNKKMIEVEDFQLAQEMLKEIERSMYAVLSGVGRNQYAEVIGKVMQEVFKLKETNLSYLMTKFRNDVTKWEMDNVIATIVQMKAITCFENTGKVVWNDKWTEEKGGE